jgi:eukaryotic-like serine/threonine-protein kinase
MPFDRLRASPSDERAASPASRRTAGPAGRSGPASTNRSKSRQIRRRVWTAGRLLVLVAALAFTYGAFFLTAVRVATRAREVHVPDVRGKSVAEAGVALGAVGLELKVDPIRRADPKVPADHVMAQEPDAGSVLRRQRSVRVRISAGQQDPIVPSLVGQPERNATAALQQENITVSSLAEIHTAEFPIDTVVAQDPPAKARSSSISLLVNRGDTGRSYVMPDLIGTEGTLVVDMLRGRGFRVTIVASVPYPGVPPGIVVRQTPQAGFQIGSGESISLEVSR